MCLFICLFIYLTTGRWHNRAGHWHLAGGRQSLTNCIAQDGGKRSNYRKYRYINFKAPIYIQLHTYI